LLFFFCVTIFFVMVFAPIACVVVVSAGCSQRLPIGCTPICLFEVNGFWFYRGGGRGWFCMFLFFIYMQVAEMRVAVISMVASVGILNVCSADVGVTTIGQSCLAIRSQIGRKRRHSTKRQLTHKQL
jgi:hypothetical protein